MALALLAWPAWAQYTGQAKSSRLRAVGVLRIDSKGVARLFPVVFYADGKYYDARLYQANPVPLAISGNIFYQAEKDGHPEGSFTVQTAMHTSTQWWAEGLWKPGGAGNAKPPGPDRQPADSDRPVLHRRSASASEAEAADADPDRPVLHRSSSPPSTPGKSDTAGGQRPADAAERAEERDPNRPTLRRGKPEREMQPDLPTMAGPGKARANAVSEAPAALASDKVLLAVADSDKIEARPYVYAWKPEDRQRDLAALQSLAADAIRRAAKDRVSLRGIDPTKLTEVETYALDPDSTNRPIEILAATVAGAASKTWLPAGSATKAPPQVRLMLVARKNSEGKLNQIFSMISDPLALDVRPSLRFLGAVDADGSGRAQLLFQQQVDMNSFSYALYHATPYDLVKTFETAAAER